MNKEEPEGGVSAATFPHFAFKHRLDQLGKTKRGFCRTNTVVINLDIHSSLPSPYSPIRGTPGYTKIL